MATRGIEPLSVRLRALRDQRGYSRSQLSRLTMAIDGKGLPEITIKDLETNPRQPHLETLELLSEALEVRPETFPEYRLALARRQLDEREVGIDQAVATLEAIESLLPR